MKLMYLSALVLGLVLVAGCKKEQPAAGGGPAPVETPTAAAETPKPPAPAQAAAPSKHPGTEEGAKALLSEFLKPGADYVALSKTLQPTAAEYKAVFASEEMAKKAEEVYGGLWGSIERMPIRPKEGQTELKMWKATTDELKAGTGNSREFPGGYARAAAHLKPGLTVYRWKFVKPGERLGMAFDGLYHINNRWVLMPKPWRITR
jgi:hypothetical protein